MAGVTSAPLAIGPGWTARGSSVFRGRFPLSVERFVMSMVSDLAPGVTTVTLNARYYSLHGYIAHVARRDNLTGSEAIERLRRAEVVLGAVSARHQELMPRAHRGYSYPHGYDKIIAALRDDGQVDVATMAGPGVYATARQGFLAAYRGSEVQLKILNSGPAFEAGDHCEETSLTAALHQIDNLVDRNVLTAADLDAYEHLCLCQMADAEDGDWLAKLFAAKGWESPRAQVRRQTLQMMNQATKIHPIVQMTDDLSSFLCFDAKSYDDDLLARLTVVDHWRGLMLRNGCTTAWRQLWAWLVDQVGGLSTRVDLADQLALRLPAVHVRAWREGLPDTQTPDGRLLNAESRCQDDADDEVQGWLGVLALSARRSHELADRPRMYQGFTRRRPDDVHEELAPAWMADQLDAWADRPLPDFARHLTQVLINRSQRIALAKARYDPKIGVLRIPTLLTVREDFLFAEGREGRGAAALRLSQLARIAAGMGLLNGNDDQWLPGPRSELLAD